MFKQGNTKKHVIKHSYSSVRVILTILVHSAHLAQSYFLILNGIIKKMFECEIAITRKHVSEQSSLVE